MTEQSTFDFLQTEPIETVFITPTKEMPFDVFKQFHHIAYFMELMEKLPDGKRVWNPAIVSIYSEGLAEAEYIGLQNDWFSCAMELPKELIARFQSPVEVSK